MYKDKHDNIIQEYNYVLVEDKKVCQALCCEDGTMLYEELELLKNDKLDLTDEPNFPDSYEPHEIEVVSKEKAIELLKNR